MNLLRISLFGRFDVRSGQQPLAGLEARKVQELFCYLLLYRDRPHPREALADLFWDGGHTDQPNRCLRKSVWQFRTALDSQPEALSDRVLLVEPEWVQLNPEAERWLDVAEFEGAFHRVQGLHGNELDAQGVQDLHSVVDLYRGGLLESWYQDWYLYERERFQHMYLVMLDKLMDHCEAQGNYAASRASRRSSTAAAPPCEILKKAAPPDPAACTPAWTLIGRTSRRRPPGQQITRLLRPFVWSWQSCRYRMNPGSWLRRERPWGPTGHQHS